MDACVCSAGTVNAQSLAKDPLKCVLQMVLNRVTMRLALPSGKRRAVVRDDKF
jgi:hypothetical protein